MKIYQSNHINNPNDYIVHKFSGGKIYDENGTFLIKKFHQELKKLIQKYNKKI